MWSRMNLSIKLHFIALLRLVVMSKYVLHVRPNNTCYFRNSKHYRKGQVINSTERVFKVKIHIKWKRRLINI